MAETIEAVIGLGANLGQPVVAFEFATHRLGAVCDIVCHSKLYQSDAIGPEQPDFTNAAVRVSFPGSPQALLVQLLRIEQDFGRTRKQRWGPRTLDLDLLWIDGVAVCTPQLTVPHPRLHERAFALLPLLDVAPQAASEEMTYRHALPQVQEQRIVALAKPPSPWLPAIDG